MEGLYVCGEEETDIRYAGLRGGEGLILILLDELNWSKEAFICVTLKVRKEYNHNFNFTIFKLYHYLIFLMINYQLIQSF